MRSLTTAGPEDGKVLPWAVRGGQTYLEVTVGVVHTPGLSISDVVTECLVSVALVPHGLRDVCGRG